MDNRDVRKLYSDLLTNAEMLTEQFKQSIKAEKKIIRKKIMLVAILLVATCTATGISVWQIVERATSQFGLSGGADIALAFATIGLLVVAIVLCSVIVSDIRQHRRDVAKICVEFETACNEIHQRYLDDIKKA